MRIFARLCVYVAAALGVCVTLLGLLSSRFGGQANVSMLIWESRRSEALQHRYAMVVHNLAVKQAILAEIVAGRLTLREAAARFQEADALVENNDPELVLARWPMAITEKETYQRVLSWTRTEVSSLPRERAEHILIPLEKEYEARFGSLEPDKP